MPYPENLEMALSVEDIVKSEGCTPATIAVLNGRVKVGLSIGDLELLAKVGMKARKASRRDLPLVLAQGGYGATTVSGTMVVAHRAGIKVFVTGGIGGVHRGGQESMDVSADLTELGRTPVAVVCAGVKAILDIERTLEYLETQGVTVVSYGGSDEFPAFYVPSSGFKSMANLSTPDECASLIKANMDLQLESGTVIAVPIPTDDAVIDPVKLEAAISDAVGEASKKGVKGKDITPFLLDRIKRLTGGQSLAANIALVKNNARVGSRIALSLSRQLAQTRAYSTTSMSPPKKHHKTFHQHRHISTQPSHFSNNRPFIIGGSVLDITAKWTDPYTTPVVPSIGQQQQQKLAGISHLPLGTSATGTIGYTSGGVGRNIAEACFRTGGDPVFFSVVGDDFSGRTLVECMKGLGMDTSGVEILSDRPTAVYNALLLADGSLLGAVADMSIHALINGSKVAERILNDNPRIVCFDGNIGIDCMEMILEACIQTGSIAIFEPTSVPKSTKILQLSDRCQRAIKYITPDRQELFALGGGIPTMVSSEREEEKVSRKLLEKFENVFLKRGSEGVLAVGRNGDVEEIVVEKHRPGKVLSECVSVTGAGDR
ncbi:hypothetical protein HDV00_006242 [Rhizophlyctis rosea]|nr:hypothetical protein HDV00_006242 [Rhizophlyctis rosea]